MALKFDPYHQWLAIPPREQPPNLYRLLGLSPFESEPAVIQSAADQRMAHVRTFQLGPQQADCQRLLNEIAHAKLVLLDPARRAAYDVVMHSAAPAAALEGPPTPAVRPVAATPPNSSTPTKAAAAISAPDFDGHTWGRFKLLESVAGSAHARTHKAQDVETGRYVFLKFIPREWLSNDEVVKRFDRECEILTQVDHPNLIGGLESFDHDGMRVLVMEYVLGTDLATLVKQQGPLPVEQAVDFALQAAQGLRELHRNGIVHRNIKPHVLLVDLQGRLRITNLLLAKIDEYSPIQTDELTTMGESMGSIDYMPPEQAVDARKVDGRSDIYALGCTLFHLLTGRPPYAGKGPMEKIVAHRQAAIPSLRQLRADVPPHVDEVFRKALVKNPAERYQTASQLIAELDAPQPLSWWQRLLATVGWK